MSKNEEKRNNDDKNKNVDEFKSISLFNENMGDGINNFDSLIENTKYAGEEINNSFQQLSENLENFTKRLKENNNNMYNK
jgi:methyl-accepting chemotaxis protein